MHKTIPLWTRVVPTHVHTNTPYWQLTIHCVLFRSERWTKCARFSFITPSSQLGTCIPCTFILLVSAGKAFDPHSYAALPPQQNTRIVAIRIYVGWPSYLAPSPSVCTTRCIDAWLLWTRSWNGNTKRGKGKYTGRGWKKWQNLWIMKSRIRTGTCKKVIIVGIWRKSKCKRNGLLW